MKKNARERMEELKNAGISVEEMLQYIIENGAVIEASKGTDTVRIEGFDTVKIKSKEEEDLISQVMKDGFIPSKQLYRRWVMAQMFHALNYRSYDGRYEGYNDYVDQYLGYKYQIDFLIDEINRIIKIRKDGDVGTCREYERIVTLSVVKKICEEIYLETANQYTDKDKKYYKDLITRLRFANEDIQHVWKWNSKYYEDLIPLLKEFRKRMLPVVEGTKKSAAFKDMYKGIGAYWTMKNMILFHDCRFKGMDGLSSINYLELKANAYFKHDDYYREYEEGGWRLFGLMKKLIKDNNFNFGERMRELRVHGY